MRRKLGGSFPCGAIRSAIAPYELSKVFRGKYLAALERAHAKGDLKTPPGTHFGALRKALREHEWVVYAKPPFGGPQQVIDYLGRYTHRIAITNRRIPNLADGKVAFTWKDYKDGSKIKETTLDAEEFIRRFTLHILPPRFVRIRHYRLLACEHRATKLNQAQPSSTAPKHFFAWHR